MNCCGEHENKGEHKEEEHQGHQNGHAGGCGGSKTSYIILGLVILLAVIFALKYLK